jgi:hypothetical protein
MRSKHMKSTPAIRQPVRSMQLHPARVLNDDTLDGILSPQVLRFANSFFSAMWDRHHIANVQIVFKEVGTKALCVLQCIWS